MSSGTVIHDDLRLGPILRQHSLLYVEEERHEVQLVRRRRQLHHPSVFQARSNSSNHRGSHLLCISDVQLRIILLRPALRLRLHGGIRSLVDPDQLMRLRSHQVAHQTAECAPLQLHALRLLHKLAEDGLTSPQLDIVLLVEAPHCVSGDLAVQVKS